MSDEELERMAYDVIDCRPVSICMCGGEPLLRKEVFIRLQIIQRTLVLM